MEAHPHQVLPTSRLPNELLTISQAAPDHEYIGCFSLQYSVDNHLFATTANRGGVTELRNTPCPMTWGVRSKIFETLSFQN